MKRVLVSFALVVVASAPASAWPKDAYHNMVYDTMRLLPPRLAHVLLDRDAHVLLGVRSLEGETASMLARDGRRGRLSPELVGDVEARVDLVVQIVAEHRSLDEMAFELGRLLRIAADLADPTVVGAGRPELARVSSEYRRFVGLHLSDIPLVHDSGLPSTVDGATVPVLLDGLAARTNASIRPLADAFWQNGRVVPASHFDFRSVPYAETSLAYSRAVTAASYLWLSAWARANGDFTGYRFSSNDR